MLLFTVILAVFQKQLVYALEPLAGHVHGYTAASSSVHNVTNHPRQCRRRLPYTHCPPHGLIYTTCTREALTWAYPPVLTRSQLCGQQILLMFIGLTWSLNGLAIAAAGTLFGEVITFLCASQSPIVVFVTYIKPLACIKPCFGRGRPESRRTI
jgi:hypothetical protein